MIIRVVRINSLVDRTGCRYRYMTHWTPTPAPPVTPHMELCSLPFYHWTHRCALPLPPPYYHLRIRRGYRFTVLPAARLLPAPAPLFALDHLFLRSRISLRAAGLPASILHTLCTLCIPAPQPLHPPATTPCLLMHCCLCCTACPLLLHSLPPLNVEPCELEGASFISEGGPAHTSHTTYLSVLVSSTPFTFARGRNTSFTRTARTTRLSRGSAFSLRFCLPLGRNATTAAQRCRRAHFARCRTRAAYLQPARAHTLPLTRTSVAAPARLPAALRGMRPTPYRCRCYTPQRLHHLPLRDGACRALLLHALRAARAPLPVPWIVIGRAVTGE